MAEALLVIQAINAIVATGINVAENVQRVSDLVQSRHDAGGSITAEDLRALFDTGDALDADVRKRIAAATGA